MIPNVQKIAHKDQKVIPTTNGQKLSTLNVQTFGHKITPITSRSSQLGPNGSKMTPILKKVNVLGQQVINIGQQVTTDDKAGVYNVPYLACLSSLLGKNIKL